MDRQVLILLQRDIAADLSLTDTELGLLTGLAFALLYTILGLPLARYADSHNRKNLLAVCLSFWSIMTVLSGFAQNFIQMMLTRIGVSAGEAGGMPPSHSILSDYFPAKQRGTVFAIYNSGIYIGILLGFVLAGVIASAHGWRVAFYTLGAPGVVLAIILSFVIREPERGRMDQAKSHEDEKSSVEVVSFLLSQKSYLYLCLGAGCMTYSLYSSTNFCPLYLGRYFELDVKTMGYGLGLGTGIGGIIGTYMGGRLADRLGKKNRRWYLYIPMLAGLLAIGPALFRYWVEDGYYAMYAVFPYVIITSAFFGPLYAVGQSLATPKMRALSTAIILFFINIIGLTCGPLVIGLVSDYLAPEHGALSLRYAITINFIGLVIGPLFFWLASRHYEGDLKKLESSLS